MLAAAPSGPAGGGMQSLIFLLLIIVVFYFFMIRPQMKKQKEATSFRGSLQKGDKVSTNGGIYGKINDVKETTILLEIADKVIVKVDKSAVMADPGDQATVAKKK